VQAIANVIATAFARDRTQHELLRAEQTASDERRRAALAQQAIRERDEFITVAAHELRTPVTALQLKLHGISHLANREAGTPSDAQKVKLRLSEALRQMGRLATLVERLIDVSRIVSGRLEVRPSEVDLGVLTSAAVESLQEQARAANVELRLRVSGDTLGAWDRRGVEHVLSSLLANALKYGRDKPVEVAVEGEEESVRLVIQDRGIGISPEDIQRIFGRFERAAPLRNYAGLGLGLYITRHIVEVHGGTIRVRSEAGKGTRFEIELPKRLPSSQVEDYSAVNL
jgi:signal transduction histidine kinase